MLDPQEIPELRTRMRERAEQDRRILETLREEVRSLKSAVKRIAPRSATSLSLVASDGGNNKIHFDPFLMQIVRVVDSFGQQLCLDVVSPTTDTDELSARQFDGKSQPQTALGHMMRALKVEQLYKLSPAIPAPRKQQDGEISPSWVLVYRDLCEWAVLHERICRTEFSTDTLMVRDHFLRAKIFSGTLFMELRRLLAEGIERARRERKRKLYLVGVAKHSKVLARYKLAMAIEQIMAEPYPCFVRVPRELESKAYVWEEYARGAEAEGKGEDPKFVAGVMYLVKFGSGPRDPIWAIDIFDPQVADEAVIFGHLLADSMDGFPIPLYPRCLQKAHEHAALVDFDMDILEEEVFRAVRGVLPAHNADALDILRLSPDPSNQRYE